MIQKIVSFLKDNKKALVVSFSAYSVLTLTIVAIAGSVLYTRRAEVSQFFFQQYLKGLEAGVVNADEKEKMILSEDEIIVNAVEKANPAVVSIVITKDVPVLERYYENSNPFQDFFGNPFGGFNFQVPRVRENGTEKKEVGGGSGFFVSKDGFVVTNKHVVADAGAEYTVLTNDGKKYMAEVVASDPVFDIAILKTQAQEVPYLEFGDSGAVKLGQKVIAIGNALGEFRNSVSVGVVSGLSRSIVAGDNTGHSELLEEVIQTDTAINPGNSGGPLLDVAGKVVGVNVAVSQGAENIGFALPANLVKGAVQSVIENGEIVRPYLGIRYVQITPALKNKNNLSVDYGVLVARGETSEDLAVIPGSPADKAGLVENDILLEVDGVKLMEGKSLAFLIRQKDVGDTLTLKVLSKGKEKNVTVTLERIPKQ